MVKEISEEERARLDAEFEELAAEFGRVAKRLKEQQSQSEDKKEPPSQERLFDSEP